MLTPERWRGDLDKTAIRDEVKPDLYKNNAARLLGLGTGPAGPRPSTVALFQAQLSE